MHDYTLKRSARAKYMRLTVRAGGEVILTVPHRFSLGTIEHFLKKHTSWIEKASVRMRRLKPVPNTRREYLARREEARALVQERIRHWNSIYNFKYGRIAIKQTKSLWGSCSRKGNLNFSFALIYVPPHLSDYIIVHELCHLKEHNHSNAFWREVARTLPHYQALRAELRSYVLK